MSVERETPFAAAGQHTTNRTRTARPTDCSTSQPAGSSMPRACTAALGRAWPWSPLRGARGAQPRRGKSARTVEPRCRIYRQCLGA